MNYSSATLEGYVTQEPIFKRTKNGKSLCTFSIAMRHHASEGNTPHVSFIDIETWDKCADVAAEHVKKGKRILTIGHIKQERWQSDEGKPCSRVKLVAHQIRLLSLSHTNEEKNEEQEERVPIEAAV